MGFSQGPAVSLLSTAVDGSTLLVTGGKASVNVGHDMAWSVDQSFTAGLTSAGQIASTVATGTAPFSVASTTAVPNLTLGSGGGLADGASVSGTIGGSPMLSGDPVFSGAPSFTGTGSTGTLTAGTGILATKNTFAIIQEFDYGIGPIDARSYTIDGSGNQGGYIGWNSISGNFSQNGSMEFLNNHGAGTGGWKFGYWDSGTSAWAAAPLEINEAGQLLSAVATGTAPFSVASTTLVANLNSERWGGAKNDVVNASLTSNLAITTAHSYISCGFGVSITPSSTRVLASAQADISDTAVASGIVHIIRSTSGIPSSNTAVPAGDVYVGRADYVYGNESSRNSQNVSVYAFDEGLTAGTTYYYYLAIYAPDTSTTVLGTAGVTKGNPVTQIMAESR